ncbi:unnamed protein product, partial [Mesorhabditis spiculigera]
MKYQASLLKGAYDLSSFTFFKRSSVQDFIIFTAKLLVERANKGTRTTVAEQEYRLHTYAVIKSDRECHYDQLPVQLTKWQNPSTSDAMTRVQEEVEETKLVMHSTIQALLDRGEKLDDLVSKSETLSEQIDSLMIVDTAVPSLPANAFQGFTILRLALNRNTLSNIDDNAFNGELLESLVELDLGDNNLGQVPQTGVTKLQNLRKLYLYRNKISNLPANSFAAWESKDLIVKISLAGNRLTDRSLGDSTVFRPFKLLQELSLETNALTQIPSAALVNQRLTLTNLNLGLNNISNVPVGALDLPMLTSLSLEFNGITVITPQAFQGVPNLQYLYVTGNKFPSWQPEMFRFVPYLRTLGIGETPISVIPNNAFQYIPNLLRLEMSEAAVDTIERGAFQRTPKIQAIVLNKNRLSQIRADFFQGLNDLYSIDVGANRISNTENLAFANLPTIQHLDISYNQLQTMPNDVFQNSFLPQPDERRVIYACAIIMTILMISICMLALIRYGISHKRKKQKDQEIEEDRYLSTAGS